MPGPVIPQKVGWPHSMSPLKKKLAALRPEYAGLDPVDRVAYEPGQIAQCDLWFPEPRISVAAGQERVLPVLVMTLCFSRFLAATMIPSRQAGDILSGMWQLVNGIGRVTKRLVWDRESAIGGTGRLSAPAAAFAGTLATKIVLAPTHCGVEARLARFVRVPVASARYRHGRERPDGDRVAGVPGYVEQLHGDKLAFADDA
jgi:hypothetical protein